MRFEGKTVFVTGASRGIGREIAMAFAREGAKVGCIATSESSASSACEAIRAAGGTAEWAACDISNSEQVDAANTKLTEALGTPYALVNNAGITRDTLMMRMSEDDFMKVIDVNLKGAFLWSKAVMRGMMKAREGRIVNVSSVVGIHGAAGQVNYSASKAGMIGMTLSIAKEVGSRGITCNAVAPGFIETDMTEELSQEMRENVVKTAPLGRLGSPADIAGAVLFLASSEASYMTGQVLTVDGGLTL